MDNAVHISQALRRHTTSGSLVILFLAAILFGPKLYDVIRGEPYITNNLSIFQNSLGEVLVEDLTFTYGPATGTRVNTVVAEDQTVLCSTEHRNTWHGERNRFWRLEAFTDCKPPGGAYRVCSEFTVHSNAGRERLFGPFCSPLYRSSGTGDSPKETP